MDSFPVGIVVATIKQLFFVALISICSVACADTWFSMGGGSVHACHTCGYNNFNPGAGLQHDVGADLRVLGGLYYNSYHKTTVYAGAAYQPLQHGAIRFGVMGGLVTNYKNLRVPVMVLPALSVEGARFGIDILGFPSVGLSTGLITVNLKYRL